MTLDEAITLCGEIIGEKYLDGHVKCASNHEQFKEWLEELRLWRTNEMGYKLYEVYTSRGQLLLTEEAEACAKFMGMARSSFYSHIQAHRKFETITNRGYYAIVSGEAVEKEITRVIEYRVKKDILVPKKIKNGLMKLVKIKKREVYKWDYLINNGYIYLAKEITSKDNIRSYKDVIKVKKDVLEKYFERCKV